MTKSSRKHILGRRLLYEWGCALDSQVEGLVSKKGGEYYGFQKNRSQSESP